MRRFAQLALIVFVLALPAADHAQVIAYTNFGAKMSFNTKTGNTVGGNTAIDQAVGFRSLATGKLSKIIVAFSGVVVTKGDNFNIGFYNGANGVPTTSSLGFLGYTPPMALGASGPLLTLVPGALGMIQITKGQTYFVDISPGVGTSLAAWNLSSPLVIGSTASRDKTFTNWSGTPNGSQGALQVEVTPEPSTFLAMGLGLTAFATRRRRLSRAKNR
jgi:hypothetical protein